MEYKALDVLSTEELATIFHFPNKNTQIPNIEWAGAKKGASPLNLPTKENLKIGITNFRGNSEVFGIKREDRRRHMYIIGKTGSGKSTLLKNMILSDIENGEGVGILDPHGDLINDILEYIPLNRMEDIVIIDPSDSEHPIGLNLLEISDQSQKDLIADGIVEVFKKHFDSWGPRLQYLLHNSILTLLSVPGSTLLGIPRILTDSAYREYIVGQINDPILIKFWNEEYAEMVKNPRLASEAVAPIQNKIGRFLSSTTIRNIIGQTESTINLTDIVNNKKILLVNLSQGKIGEETAALFGGMLITRLESIAMQRILLPEELRKDFYLYVDEFQTFANESFSKILSEARKYRLNLILTHQYIQQLPLEVQDAVFGNVGNLISFTVGPKDAEVLAKEFIPKFNMEDLISLEKHHIYIKETIDGTTASPFSAVTVPFEKNKTNIKAQVIQFSREKYGREKDVVEDNIRKWLVQSYYSSKQSEFKKEQASLFNTLPEISLETNTVENILENTPPRINIQPVHPLRVVQRLSLIPRQRYNVVNRTVINNLQDKNISQDQRDKIEDTGQELLNEEK